MKKTKAKNKVEQLLKKNKRKAKILKGKNGITLIALIVIIVVLLILAGVSIATLTGDNGILTQANKAKENTEQAEEEELRKLTSLEATTNLKNQPYTDENGDTATIPAGFAVSQVEGENTIENGLVIIDNNGNEFVWIPVENKLEKLEGTKEEYIDPEDFTEIENQIYKYGGFYIGRYETSVMEENDTENVMIKKGEWPKVNLTKDNAKTFSNTYISNEYVQSNLIYGLEWDRVLKLFTEKNLLTNEDLNNSKNYGNYSDSTFKFLGNYKMYEAWNLFNIVESTKINEKPASLTDGNGYLLQTGKTEYSKLFNIYDLAGNVAEWTMEGFISGNNDNIYRGGYCLVPGTESIKYRNEGVNDTWINDFVGFRICLYLK